MNHAYLMSQSLSRYVDWNTARSDCSYEHVNEQRITSTRSWNVNRASCEEDLPTTLRMQFRATIWRILDAVYSQSTVHIVCNVEGDVEHSTSPTSNKSIFSTDENHLET